MKGGGHAIAMYRWIAERPGGAMTMPSQFPLEARLELGQSYCQRLPCGVHRYEGSKGAVDDYGVVRPESRILVFHCG